STHDLIQGVYKERLFHVGRLDKNSSGLIFFTNDGDFAQAVQHPSAVIEKEYEVKTRKNIPEFMLQHWMRGIRIAGVRYQLSRYRMLGPHRVRLVLTEGLNREIRRVFEHFHIPLKQVHRLRIGTVRLYGLAPGEFRHLKPFEWKVLKSGKNANRMGEWPSQETAEPREARHLRSSRRQGRETASPQPPGLYNTPSRPYRNEPSAHLRRERKKRNRTEIGRTSPYPKRTGSDSRKKTSEGTRYVRKSNYRR
ncbi:MAG: pseudouridine synthase, partial [Spirochaetota bacterium]